MELILIALCLCLVSSAPRDVLRVQEQEQPLDDVLDVPNEDRMVKREVPSVWDLLTGNAPTGSKRVARDTDHMVVMGSPFSQQSGPYEQFVEPDCFVQTNSRSATPWQAYGSYQLPQGRSESQLRTTGAGSLPSLPSLPNLGSLLGGLGSIGTHDGGLGGTGGLGATGGLGSIGVHDGLGSTAGLLDGLGGGAGGLHGGGIGGLHGGGHGGHHLSESLVTPVHKENIYAAIIPYIAGYKMTPIIAHKKVIVKDHDLGHLARSSERIFYEPSPNFPVDRSRSAAASQQDFYIEDPNARHPLDLNIFFVDPKKARDASEPEFLSHDEYVETIDNLQQQLNHLQSLKLAQELHTQPDALNFVE